MIIGWEIHASDNADILTRSSRVAKCSQIIFIYAASTIAAIGHTAYLVVRSAVCRNCPQISFSISTKSGGT